MPSEHALDSPLTTINTVCGRSREIARPRALRYRFSWSRLESSCSLENKSGARVKPIFGWWKKTKLHKKAADLAITVKKSMVLVNKRLNSLTPILGSGGAGWLQVWTLSLHSLPFTALYGTKSTHFIICSSCLACASFSSISVTSYEKQDKTLSNPTLIQKDFDFVMK